MLVSAYLKAYWYFWGICIRRVLRLAEIVEKALEIDFGIRTGSVINLHIEGLHERRIVLISHIGTYGSQYRL